jgi:hypothetical protein
VIEVTILTQGVKQRLGSASFAKVPISEATDFSCSPAGIISLESAKLIAEALHRGEVSGKVDGMEWRRETN